MVSQAAGCRRLALKQPILQRLTRVHIRTQHSINKPKSGKASPKLFAAASSARAVPASDEAAVRASFAEAGLSGKAVEKVLKWYPSYLRWDVNTKLAPALQLWHEELGSTELTIRLQQLPRLLTSKPSEANAVSLWLASMNIDVVRVQRQTPIVFSRSLPAVQSSVSVFQTAAQFTDAQLPVLFHKHPAALTYDSLRNLQQLQCIGDLLAAPMASEKVRSTVLAGHRRLFQDSSARLAHSVTTFCKMFGVSEGVAERAIKSGVFSLSDEQMQSKALELQRLLGWDQAHLKKVLSAVPLLLVLATDRVATNMKGLEAHGFTKGQVLDMCSSQPSLLWQKWSSSTQLDKIQFLTLILSFSLDELSQLPHNLMYSFTARMGPRAVFLLQHRFVDTLHNFSSTAHFSLFVNRTDAHFAKKYSISPSGCPILYDSDYVQHWQQQWTYLRQHMQLPVRAIAAHEELLLASVPNRLAPRWEVLTQLAARQADFRAADHLQALAALSDADFAQAYSLK